MGLHAYSLFSLSVFIDFGWSFRWDAFVPLHRLWLGYMSELLGLGTAPSPSEPLQPQQEGEEGKGPSRSAPGPAPTPALPQPAGTMHAKLIKADFHGSIMTGESFGSYLFVSFLWRGSEAKRGDFDHYLLFMRVLYGWVRV